MTLQDILKEYLERHNITGREFARQCEGKISYPYVANILRGYSPSTGEPPKVSNDKLRIIAQGMGMTFEEMRDMMNDRPAKLVYAPEPRHLSPEILNIIPSAMPYTPGVAVPIVGTVRCGPGGLAFEDLQGAALAEVSNPSDYFYLRAEGDSMAPQIMAGDLVLVHIQPEVETGELAVIIVNGEEGMLKKYVRKDNAVILMSLNQEYPPRVFVGEEMNLVKVAGKVVESKRKY